MFLGDLKWETRTKAKHSLIATAGRDNKLLQQRLFTSQTNRVIVSSRDCGVISGCQCLSLTLCLYSVSKSLIFPRRQKILPSFSTGNSGRKLKAGLQLKIEIKHKQWIKGFIIYHLKLWLLARMEDLGIQGTAWFDGFLQLFVDRDASMQKFRGASPAGGCFQGSGGSSLCACEKNRLLSP